MIFLTQLLFIVFAVSLDGFTVGITYGLRKISITILTLMIIVACSGIVVFCSMVAGNVLSRFISPTYAAYSGSIILIGLGLFLLLSLVRTKIKIKKKPKSSYGSFIDNPTMVDSDNSGTLSISEALVLGIALALDAFGAGFAAAMLGFPVVTTTIFVAIASGLFVFSGFKLGHLLSHIKWINQLTYVPPILLIGIGLSSFW